jgi:DNA-binding HxlR family transcriptional regulator
MPTDTREKVFGVTTELRQVMELFSGKWTLLTVGVLQSGPHRHMELRQLLDGISQKMLTQTLRKLEANGLIQRTVVSSRPPHVTYALTARGQTVTPILCVLRDWAETNAG